MVNDPITNKVQVIERCVKRIKEEYDGDPENLEDYTKQDSIILNIQKACEASIDLAMHMVSKKKLGLPQNSREAFDLLQQANLLDQALMQRMKTMVGFRNIDIHDYQTVNLSIVQQIIERHLQDLTTFGRTILKQN